MSKPSSPSPAPGSDPLARNWSADVPEVPAPKPYDVDLYFDHWGGCYFRRDDRGNYIRATVASARRYLRTLGFSAKSEDGRPSDLDRVLEYVETAQNCGYAAALAGYKAGLYTINERRILVTSSPNLIDPVPGSWDTLAAVFNGLLGAEQCRWFFLWLKLGIEAVRHCRYRPGQALIVAGSAGCGKNLLQSIITYLLGGRAAKPFRYLCGRTEFNSETFVAEHLVIQDESASSDPRVRKKFGSEIKGLVANELQSCHGKGSEALELTPIWRLSITLNDDPASLLVLPQWEDELTDKLMLFYAKSFPMPVDTSTPAGREMLMRQLRSELPAFVHHLEGLTIPEEMKDPNGRFGVRAYHNPDLLGLMDAATDEMKLLEMIDAKLFTDPQAGAWEGYARELEDELAGVSGLRQLLTSVNTCGLLLGALARKKERVEMLPKLHGSQRWRVHPPR
jgi:hypothetical protein